MKSSFHSFFYLLLLYFTFLLFLHSFISQKIRFTSQNAKCKALIRTLTTVFKQFFFSTFLVLWRHGWFWWKLPNVVVYTTFWKILLASSQSGVVINFKVYTIKFMYYHRSENSIICQGVCKFGISGK